MNDEYDVAVLAFFAFVLLIYLVLSQSNPKKNKLRH
jgi:hypothetical protein